MKKLKIIRPIRVFISFLSVFILIIWSFYVFFWYIVITSDIPPTPIVSELHSLEQYVFYWLIVLIENIALFSFTKETRPS